MSPVSEYRFSRRSARIRPATGDFLNRDPMASSRAPSARRIAASHSAPNSGTSVVPSSPVDARTAARHSARALFASGPSDRAAARSTGLVNRGRGCFAGTPAAISTIGPRFSTRPALTTSDTEDATSDGSRDDGEPGAETRPPAGQRCMSTFFSAEERYSMRSKTSSNFVAFEAEAGWMMAESIWDAAPSQLFLAAAISLPFPAATPLNTTTSVDGRFLSVSLSPSSAIARNASSLSTAGPR
mmetsp:Transcript_39686/g.95457  ORF Transcript_39686/g.95457 Transcript_39686/m.95457 type:complete len:242 (-) Transcript_39686:609-1334(-)